MNKLVLDLTDEQLELLEEMTWYTDRPGYQSEEMETLGQKIREAIEEFQ